MIDDRCLHFIEEGRARVTEWRGGECGQCHVNTGTWTQGRPIRGQGCGAPTNEQRRGGDIISWGSGVYRCTERGGAPGVCTEFTLDTLPLSSLPPLAQLYLMKSVKSYKALEGGETIQSSQNTAPILWKNLSICTYVKTQLPRPDECWYEVLLRLCV